MLLNIHIKKTRCVILDKSIIMIVYGLNSCCKSFRGSCEYLSVLWTFLMFLRVMWVSVCFNELSLFSRVSWVSVYFMNFPYVFQGLESICLFYELSLCFRGSWEYLPVLWTFLMFSRVLWVSACFMNFPYVFEGLVSICLFYELSLCFRGSCKYLPVFLTYLLFSRVLWVSVCFIILPYSCLRVFWVSDWPMNLPDVFFWSDWSD